MKKISIALSTLFLLVLAACGNEEPTSVESTGSSSPTEESTVTSNENDNAAIVYYSLTGNTKEVAETIQAQTNAEIFEIQTVEPYPEEYEDVLALAQEQRDTGALPELEPLELRIEEYDTIFIGSPIWFGDMALPLQKWVTDTSLEGKTIIPFFTSGSSSISGAMNEVEELLPNSTISEGLGIPDRLRNNMDEEVTQWLQDL